MSTRKGNFVTLEDVLSAAKARVAELIHSRPVASDLSPEDLQKTSEQVAIGAVVFHDLFSDPARDVEFDLERVVDFDGETGPYLQYAHTRCLSILRKAQAGAVPFQKDKVAALTHPLELALVKALGMFPIHLERSLETKKASQLAHYLIEVTKLFGGFYRECQVLGLDPNLTQARLMLVEATRRVLAQGLTLLGVPLPGRM